MNKKDIKKIAIVNAPVCNAEFNSHKYDYIIAIETGYAFLNVINSPIDIVMGDFDTFSIDNVNHKNVVIKKDQSLTDLEQALIHARELSKDARIDCYQRDGKRNSHFMVQANLMIKYNAQIIYDNSKMMFISRGLNNINSQINECLDDGKNYEFISFFAFESNNIKIQNAKYDYEGEIGFENNAMFISNEFIQGKEIEVSIEKESKVIAILENEK